jgi:hypothetical protein
MQHTSVIHTCLRFQRLVEFTKFHNDYKIVVLNNALRVEKTTVASRRSSYCYQHLAGYEIEALFIYINFTYTAKTLNEKKVVPQIKFDFREQ